MGTGEAEIGCVNQNWIWPTFRDWAGPGVSPQWSDRVFVIMSAVRS